MRDGLRSVLLIFLVISLFELVSSQQNPYKVLGVSKFAELDDIKQAYKALAKKWHPDKNKGEEAHQKFLEVQEAYDILSDSEKRKQFDNYGRVHTESEHGDHAYFNRHHQYYTTSRDGSLSTRLTNINFDHLVGSMGGDSSRVHVWLIFVYGRFCPQCDRINSHWEDAAKQLHGIVHTAKVFADFEQDLCRRIGVRSVPTVFAVRTTAGKSQTVWSQIGARTPPSQLSSKELVRFALSVYAPQDTEGYLHVFPADKYYKTVAAIVSRIETLRTSLKGKSFVVAFSKQQDDVALVALTAAADKFKDTVVLAYVCLRCLSTSASNEEQLVQRVGINLPLNQLFTSSSHRQLVVAVFRDATPDYVQTVDLSGNTATHSGAAQSAQIIEQFLELHHLPLVPKLTTSNYYELCFATPDVDRSCLIFFESLERSRAIGLALAKDSLAPSLLRIPTSNIHNSAQPTSPSTGTTQMGWVNGQEQKRFVQYFSEAKEQSQQQQPQQQQLAACVLVRPSQNRYFLCPSFRAGLGTDVAAGEIIKWLQQQQQQQIRLKVEKSQAGLPFLEDEPKSFLSFSFLEDLDLGSGSITSLFSGLLERGSFLFHAAMTIGFLFLSSRVFRGML